MVASSQCEGVCPAHYKCAWPIPSLSCPIPSQNKREKKAHEHGPELLRKGELGTLWLIQVDFRSGLAASTASHTSRAHAQGHPLGEFLSPEPYWQSWKGLIQPWKREGGKLQANDRPSPPQDAHGDEQGDPVSPLKGKGWGSVSLH